MIHRDVKPGNVIVGPGDHLTLIDFGIARAAEESRLTHAGTVLGTPDYIAPETFAGQASGPSADRYALGVVAYELLLGRVPFSGTAVEIARAQVERPLPAPRLLRPDLPESVERALLRQLATDPAERYPSAQAFVAALADPPAGPRPPPDEGRGAIRAPPVPAGGRASGEVPTLVLPRSSSVSAGRSSKRLLVPILVGAALLVGAVAAYNRLINSPASTDPVVAAARSAQAATATLAVAGASVAPGPAAGQAPAATSTVATAPSPVAAAQLTPPTTGPAATPLPSPSPVLTARIVFEDRFATNDRGWPNNPAASAWFADGVYHLFGRDQGRFVAVGAPLARTFGDVTVQGTFRKTGGPPGGGYGLILRDEGPDARDGRSQAGRYYVFESGDKGEFGIWRRELTHWVELIPWTRSAAINADRGRNELAVRALGPRFTFLINETQVASVEDAALPRGGVGVYLGGDLNEVAVEHFLVQTAD